MSEWTVYSPKHNNFKLVYADNQKQAILKANQKYGYLPGQTDDARTRTGTETVMTKEEFQQFMKNAEVV